MRKFALLGLLLLSQQALSQPTSYAPREGDFVFQSLPKGDLVDAIEGASRSPYSHVGLVIKKQSAWYVREAIGEVIDTPLPEWIDRGRHHAFDAYRLKNRWQKFVPALIKKSQAFVGRPYDYKYDMDDENIYCSELIYKSMLNASGVRLGKLQKLGELNWRPYRRTIEESEGGPVPLERRMITPRSLSESIALYKEFNSISQPRRPDRIPIQHQVSRRIFVAHPKTLKTRDTNETKIMDTLPTLTELSKKTTAEIAEITRNLPQINKQINQEDIKETYILTIFDGISDGYRYNLVILKNDKKTYIERLGGLNDSRAIFGPIQNRK